MKKFTFSLLVLISVANFTLAQKKELIVKSSDKGLYLEHKVASKESFYGVGRLYNVNPKNIASFNKLDIAKGLQIDQKLKIPLTDTNFIQEGLSGTPVYYKVGDKEGLMTVSKKHNNVKLTNIRTWNNLFSDEVKEDTKLIIGFLQSKEMPSVTLSVATKIVEEPKVKTEEKPISTEPKVEEKPVVKEEKPVVKPEEKPVTKIEVKPATIDQGYFKSHFDQQIKRTPLSKDATVTSGIFKTTSGWQDAKFYLLIDAVQPGTIVKVVNPTNNKAVYAKVLGEMSGIRQNEGLNIRISNAAAAMLDIKDDDKFIVKVNY
jgi:LysM domain